MFFLCLLPATFEFHVATAAHSLSLTLPLDPLNTSFFSLHAVSRVPPAHSDPAIGCAAVREHCGHLREPDSPTVTRSPMELTSLASELSDVLTLKNPGEMLRALHLVRHIQRRFCRKGLPGVAIGLDAPFLQEAHFACTFACAAYGAAGASFIALSDRSVPVLGRLPAAAKALVQSETTAFLAGVGLEPDDLLLRGGGSGSPLWFVTRDSAHESIVLTLRGTMSLSDCIIDARAKSEPFAAGSAHVGIASAAKSVWRAVESVVRAELASHPTFRFIITGHSLGGACAQLIAISLAHDAEIASRVGTPSLPLDGRRIDVFAYAPPPVFAGRLPASFANLSLTTLIHSWDIIPRLSLRTIDELSRVCAVLVSSNSFLQMQTGTLGAAIMTAVSGVRPEVELRELRSREPGWSERWATPSSEWDNASTVSGAARNEDESMGATTGGAGAAPSSHAAAAAPDQLFIPGAIYVFRSPGVPTATPDDDEDSAAASASAAGAGGGWTLLGPSDLLAPFTIVRDMVTRLSAQSCVAEGGGADATPAEETDLLTLTHSSDAHLQSLPVFDLRVHTPDNYLHGLRELVNLAR